MVEEIPNWVLIIIWILGIGIVLFVIVFFILNLPYRLCMGSGKEFGLLSNIICGIYR